MQCGHVTGKIDISCHGAVLFVPCQKYFVKAECNKKTPGQNGN